MMAAQEFRQKLADQVALPLRIVAKRLAEGRIAGLHRASTRGAGIEFAGHRPYTPGDDLRHLDRHAQLRHNRLLIRQFQTDTERAAHIVCDVSQSMVYADEGSPTKLDLALLLAASLAYAAKRAGDQVGLTLIDENKATTLLPGASQLGLERIISILEDQKHAASASQTDTPPQTTRPGSNLDRALSASHTSDLWKKTLVQLGSSLARGAMIFVISDFLDLTPEISRQISQLATRSRTVRAAQVLAPSELTFPFEGAMRFVDPETGAIIQTDAKKAKIAYLEALSRCTSALQSDLVQLGGVFLRATTDSSAEVALATLASGRLLGGEK